MAGELEAGFAKLQGEDFEYFMQTYSIVLGRNSKKSSVDVDLAGLGGGMNISRQHARIYYDFDRKRFSLEVLGKNGCHVQGSLYHPGGPHVKLDSQYLLQIGDKKFYFLLPLRSIIKQPSSTPPPHPHPPPSSHLHSNNNYHTSPLVMTPTIAPTPIPLPMSGSIPLPMHLPPSGSSSRKRQLPKSSIGQASPLIIKNDDMFFQPSASKKVKGQNKKHETMEMKPTIPTWQGIISHDSSTSYMMPTTHARQGMLFHTEPKVEVRRPPDAGTEASPMQAEEKEVVSAVATVLSDLCGPGEWMPMLNLHSELVEHYSGIWPPARVRKFLTAEEVDGDNKGRPWAGLLALLRKFPEHFVINTRIKGRMTSEFVSLVSLLS